MRNKFLLDTNESNAEINVYADKSSLILEWLFIVGIERENFSLREVVRDVGVSVGLVQKVFYWLVLHGYLGTEGVGTSKKFILLNPKPLLTSWMESYSISKKCRMWRYSSAFQGRKELLDVLGNSNLSKKVVRALHSAVDVYKCNNTNLETLELYIPDSNIRPQIEELLQLEPQGRGYDVLLVDPYYKHMVRSCIDSPERKEIVPYTKPLLTFLDLYHFPLRGLEQAEYMAERSAELKKINRPAPSRS